MAGRADLSAADRVVDLNIWSANDEGDWFVAREPLHDDKPKLVGLGPGLSFARAVAAEGPPKTVIGLVPAAVGGTSIDEWLAPGGLLDGALDQVDRASEGVVDGVLWHQGEQDVGTLDTREYASRLEEIIAIVDDELGPTPIVLGELGPFIEDGETINRALHDVASLSPTVGVASSLDLTTDDGVHFDAPSTRRLGQRFAEAYLALEDRESRE